MEGREATGRENGGGRGGGGGAAVSQLGAGSFLPAVDPDTCWGEAFPVSGGHRGAHSPHCLEKLYLPSRDESSQDHFICLFILETEREF